MIILRHLVLFVIAVNINVIAKKKSSTPKAERRFVQMHPLPIDLGAFPADYLPIPSGPCDTDAPYRTIDGSCNNLDFPTWGQARTPFIRFIPPDYADGVDAPRARKDGSPLPNARIVGLAINEDLPIETPFFTTLFVMWGQFINHDINNKLESKALDGSDLMCCFPDETPNPDPGCMPILLTKNDPFFGQFGRGCMHMARSAAFPSPYIGYRENINNNSAFIDASTLYGSHPLQAADLRTFKKGLMRSMDVPVGKPVLPLTGTNIACVSITGACYLTGDFRANMLPPLTTLHIMLMREHNRIATELNRLNPQWNDERLYQEARKITSALVQHVTYNEYLPLVLSPEYMKVFDLFVEKFGYYKGYDPTINPSIDNAFAAAAYRFGHSLIQGRFHRYQPNHKKIAKAAPPLGLELREPLAIFNGELDKIAIGLTNQRSRERDEHFSTQVTNYLFLNRTLGLGSGLDLLAININRGRDNGIPGYNDWREYCGVGRIRTFEDLYGLMPDRVIHAFSGFYGHVDDIDLFPAGIAEYRVEGGIVGPVFSCILAQQFRNLRKGDRFWYENGGHKAAFTPAQLEEIRKGSLARLFCDNFNNVVTIQLRPMEVPHGRVHCSDPFLHTVDLGAWKEFGPYPDPSHYVPPPLAPHPSIFPSPIHFADSPPQVQVFQQLITRRKSTEKTHNPFKTSSPSPFNHFDALFSSIEEFDDLNTHFH